MERSREYQTNRGRKKRKTLSSRSSSNHPTTDRLKRRSRSSSEERNHKRERPSEKPPSIGKTIVKSVFNGLYYLVVITIVASATLFALNRDTSKSYFGYRFFTVLTDSMVPKKDSLPGGFRSGDMIVVQSMDGRDAKEGDIVTFLVGDSQDKFLTHRVVKTMKELNGEEGDFVITRGDANNTDDPPFSAKKIVGKKIFMIPNVGFIAEFVRENIWICLAFILGLLGFLLVLRYYFFSDGSTKQPSTRY
ncbi:signal peptidase I [Vagococcus sp. BWB3-3]|uniref:Signal peptidase I n=1 Tax=Vagococcus allomyrinae TaxID=2794353 RepID=A0A940PA78_9ENTE|nr:signal peptidase I [Vagococcus allomyrinae]MBP1044614.1 signal peptidase I [Vagococcus allomyrinae]